MATRSQPRRVDCSQGSQVLSAQSAWGPPLGSPSARLSSCGRVSVDGLSEDLRACRLMGRAKIAGIAGPDRRSPGIDLHRQIVCGILQERGIATDSSHYYEWYAIQLYLRDAIRRWMDRYHRAPTYVALYDMLEEGVPWR